MSKSIIALTFTLILSFCVCFSHACFDGDFVTMQKNILEESLKVETEDFLIIETPSFSISNLISKTEKEETNTDVQISISGLVNLSQGFEIERQLAIQNASIYTAGINMKYPFYVTHTTVEEYNYILKGTKLEGYGYCFKQIEEIYGINGLFAMAVSKLESGMGKSNLAINKNNFYGIRSGSNGWAKFDTVEEGILYFGKLMNKKIYYGKTIEKIAPTYCNVEWGNKVSTILGSYIKRIEGFRNAKNI